MVHDHVLHICIVRFFLNIKHRKHKNHIYDTHLVCFRYIFIYYIYITLCCFGVICAHKLRLAAAAFLICVVFIYIYVWVSDVCGNLTIRIERCSPSRCNNISSECARPNIDRYIMDSLSPAVCCDRLAHTHIWTASNARTCVASWVSRVFYTVRGQQSRGLFWSCLRLPFGMLGGCYETVDIVRVSEQVLARFCCSNLYASLLDGLNETRVAECIDDGS